MILAIDTSSALTSVALCDGGRVIAEAEHLDARKHAEIAAPLIAQVVDDRRETMTGLRAVVCGVGPGPYTGLRVGIASAIALGLAWEVPVLGMCSLDAIAEERMAHSGTVHGEDHVGQDHVGQDVIHVAIDARRAEVYWAAYAQTGERLEGPLVVAADGDRIAPATVSFPHARWLAMRAARLLDAGATVAHVDYELDAHGADGSATAAALRGASLLPPVALYLRRPDAKEPAS